MLIVGSVAFDSIKTPFGKLQDTLGGSGAYASLAASRFVRPALVAAVGDDFTKDHQQTFARLGIDISGLQKISGKTFRWGGEYGFDMNSRKTLFTELNVLEKFSPKLSPAHRLSACVFLGNIHPALQLQVEKQLQRPRMVGLDTMNYWIDKSPGQLATVVKKINILVINDAEARQWSGQTNLLYAARFLLGLMRRQRGQEPTVVIKRGEYGLLMFSPSRKGLKIFHLPGFPLEEVKDPTGAGDSFAGGYFGYLAGTKDYSWENLKRAAVSGSAMASFCVQELGAQALLSATPAKIKKRVEEYRTLTRFEI